MVCVQICLLVFKALHRPAPGYLHLNNCTGLSALDYLHRAICTWLSASDYLFYVNYVWIHSFALRLLSLKVIFA